MKPILITLLLLFSAWGWAQQEIVIEGPNDKVAVVKLQVKSDFDAGKGILKLTLTGDDTEECNALCLLQEATPFGNLEKYFKQQEGKLSISSFAKEQMKFLNLSEKTAMPVLQVAGAQLMAPPVVQTKSGVKAPIQKQILPLDNRSTLMLTLQVEEGIEQVTLTLNNPLLLMSDNGKYELAFVGKDVSTDFSVVVDHCLTNACLLDQIREYKALFREGIGVFTETKSANAACASMMRQLLLNEYTMVDLKRFRNTKCDEITAELDTLQSMMNSLKAMRDDSGSGGGGGGNAGQAGAPTTDDCNFKKVNDDLKAAVVKMNTYANDWVSASDAAVKQAKKVAFDSVIKETDAKVNALSPTCRKKLDSNSLKNYEMAKKLIKN